MNCMLASELKMELELIAYDIMTNQSIFAEVLKSTAKQVEFTINIDAVLLTANSFKWLYLVISILDI